jgi:hypothetical protein
MHWAASDLIPSPFEHAREFYRGHRGGVVRSERLGPLGFARRTGVGQKIAAVNLSDALSWLVEHGNRLGETALQLNRLCILVIPSPADAARTAASLLLFGPGWSIGRAALVLRDIPCSLTPRSRNG